MVEITKLLVPFNRLLVIYKNLKKSSSSNNIIAIADEQLNSVLSTADVKQFFGNMDETPFLDFGDGLLSDHETIIRRTIDECITINDSICNQYDIQNKLDLFRGQFEDLKQKKYYKALFQLILKNCKYLINQLKEVQSQQREIMV